MSGHNGAPRASRDQMLDPMAVVCEERHLSLAELLGWLHARVGSELLVGAGSTRGAVSLRARGRLDEARELWPHLDAPIVFRLGRAELRLWPRQFRAAWWQRLCLPGGASCELIEIQLRGGGSLAVCTASGGSSRALAR